MSVTVLSDLIRGSDSAFLKIFELAVPVIGKPTATEVLCIYVPSRAITLDNSITFGKAGVAATASSVFTIKKNGSSIGTFTFAISGTTATINLTSTAISAGDIITITAPSSQDATLADIGLTLGGIRT